MLTTIFIRLKNILTFGLILLCVSFIWIGIMGMDIFDTDNVVGNEERNVLPVTNPGDEMIKADTINEPTVTIEPREQGETRDSFFNEYRIERDRTRSEQVEILREIVNNPNSSGQMRQEAQQKLIAISDNLEKESKIENALIAKGLKEAVVVIQKGAVMVIVSSNGLRQDEIARIADIVVKVTGCKMEDVVIVPKAP